MNWLRNCLLILSMAGVLFSSVGFAVTFANDRTFEDWAHRFVVWRVEQEIRKFTTPEVDGEGALAAVRKKLVERANVSERLLGSDFAERVATKTAELCVCNLDIREKDEKRRRFIAAKESVSNIIRNGLKGDIKISKIGIGTLEDLIAGYYVETVEGLKRDLRIFFGSNLFLYAVVGLGATLSAVGGAMIAPGSLLFTGTVLASSFYLFGQDWLSTILFHSWTGYAYLAWVALITGFLADIFLNQARLTIEVVASISNSLANLC